MTDHDMMNHVPTRPGCSGTTRFISKHLLRTSCAAWAVLTRFASPTFSGGMVSEQMPKRKKIAVSSDKLSVPTAASVQVVICLQQTHH